jgi:predicted RNase H-like HicB family nuclease
MAPKVINIIIKEVKENNDTYYLAESPDVENFFAEADSLEEILKIAPEVMEMILELDRKKAVKENTQQHLFQKVIFDMKYRRKVDSHLQFS